jgi:hypothetical protein
MKAPETCPNCGADVPRNARACPECGSDEQTGWAEDGQDTQIDLPEENFDYDEYVKREFGAKKHVPHGLHWIWWVAGLLLLGALIGLWFLR